MKFFFKVAAILLLLVSCDLEDLPDGTIIFYNFSPVTITELKVYDSSTTGGFYSEYIKKDLVYTYTGEIKTAELHQFVLSERLGYFFEVKTEEGETYEGGGEDFDNFGPLDVIFSVDYDILEYDGY